jgi:hypothetical protein
MEVRPPLDNILFSTGKRPTNELRELSGRLLRIQDAEHPRVARELHDSIAQELAAVPMDLDELQKRIEGRDRAGDKFLSDSMGTGACRRRGAEGSESWELQAAPLQEESLENVPRWSDLVAISPPLHGGVRGRWISG